MCVLKQKLNNYSTAHQVAWASIQQLIASAQTLRPSFYVYIALVSIY